MLILQLIYIDLKSLFCMCITVKIQFDNTRTCKYMYSIIPVLAPPIGRYAPTSFWAPLLKNSGSAPCHRVKG